MSNERKSRTPQPLPSETSFVQKEVYDELSVEYVILRRALRDCLHQAGIPSNPGWTDQDIIASLAGKLGVRDSYQETSNLTRRHLIQNDLQTPSKSNS